MGKFLNFIGLEESDEEESLQDELQPEQPKKEQPRSRRRENQLLGGGAPQPVPKDLASMKMIVYHPVCYDDAQNIVDNLKNRRPVIVNMEELEGSCAQRVLDFLLGAIYAQNGTINKISRGIFLVAPHDVDVEDTGEDSGGYTDM